MMKRFHLRNNALHACRWVSHVLSVVRSLKTSNVPASSITFLRDARVGALIIRLVWLDCLIAIEKANITAAMLQLELCEQLCTW